MDHYRISLPVPDLAGLHRLSSAFALLPYENVTKILKSARASESAGGLRFCDEVLQDHLRWNTGGTCFSLCNALQNILEHSGYDSFIAMADMHYGADIHCAVIVNLLGDSYLLDPGYLIHQPMLLPKEESEAVVQTQMNTVILSKEVGDCYSLSTTEHGQTKWRYRLKCRPITSDEFQAHWIHSFSLNTMENVMLSAFRPQGRIYFRKNKLEEVGRQGRSSIRIDSAKGEEIARLFGIPPDLFSEAGRILLARPTHCG